MGWALLALLAACAVPFLILLGEDKKAFMKREQKRRWRAYAPWNLRSRKADRE